MKVTADENFDEFCSREAPRLVGALSLYTGDALLAQELAQEALMCAYENWERVRAMSAPGAWTHRTAMNLANSFFRRRRIERRALKLEGAQQTAGRETPDSENRIEGVAEAHVVRQLVSRLPQRQREVLTLRFFYDLSHRETAELMGITNGYARVLCHRAVTALRKKLKSQEGSDVY